MSKGRAKQVIPAPRTKRLVLQPEFVSQIEDFIRYSFEEFGADSTLKLLKEIDSQIKRISVMPDANPKDKHLPSTPAKTYRNIIVKSFVITYRVTRSEVTVLDLHHKAAVQHVKK